MLLNYLKLSLRLLARTPFFSFINIFGLAIGFASFFALWDFSYTELHADQYHQYSNRIGRINYDWRWEENQKWDHVKAGISKPDIAVRAKEDFAEVEDFTRIHKQVFFNNGPDGLVTHGRKIMMSPFGGEDRKTFKEEHIIYADANLFMFFSIPLIYGTVFQAEITPLIVQKNKKP